jgi:hypothetical protein
MRKTFVALTAAALCLGLAAPALAKGEGEMITETSATIEGRGLAAPIHLTSNRDCGVVFPCADLADLDDPLVNLATLTGVGFQRPSYSKPYDVGPAGGEALGPRYRITYTVEFADGVTRTLVQDAYPWAGKNGWIFTPKGQKAFEGEIEGGWALAPTTLRSTLIDLGIPSQPPAAPPAAPIRDTQPAPSPAPVIGLTSLLLLMLVAGAVIIALARRGQRPATLT